MNWVEAIVSNLRDLLTFVSPLRVINVYERGVVLRLGKIHRVMEPGLNWLIPFNVDVVSEIVVVEETMDLMVQSITTKDDVSVTFSINLVFCVVDPMLYHTAVTDFNRSAEGYARIHLSQRARDKTWPELLADQRKLEASLEGTLSTRLAKWGATVVSVGFTDLTRARPFRLFADPASAQKGLFG
jgi:regulator of protease activity HflC (stomatin/prohibitin superfamily)